MPDTTGAIRIEVVDISQPGGGGGGGTSSGAGGGDGGGGGGSYSTGSGGGDGGAFGGMGGGGTPGGGGGGGKWTGPVKSFQERLAEFRANNPQFTSTFDIISQFKKHEQEQQQQGQGQQSLGWRRYLNQEMPYASQSISMMQYQQEQQTQWMRGLLGLPDRLERAIVRAHEKAVSKGDKEAAVDLQRTLDFYQRRSFETWHGATSATIEQAGRWFFKEYRGLGADTLQTSEAIKTIGTKIAAVFPPIAPVVGLLSKVLGTAGTIVGLAQQTIGREAQRVGMFSPELRMQSVTNTLRELQTDMEMARKFGAQMARQEDQDSRRERAWRLLSTSVATTVAKPFEQINETWTSMLEAMSGQRGFMDAAVNAFAAIPAVGDFFKGEADRRNAEFKQQAHQLEIDASKELCVQILDIVLPGEEGMKEFAPPMPQQKRRHNKGGEVNFQGAPDLLKQLNLGM